MQPLLFRIVTFGLLVGLTAGPLGADPAARLTQAVDDLESLAVELQAHQDETAALRDQLAALASLSQEHRQTLADQAAAEERYQATVGQLQAQAERSLRTAEDLQTQLNREHQVSAWLWPAALTATALAVLEALVLVFR